MTSSPLSRPLTCMFALPVTNTLTLYPSSSSLPVNNWPERGVEGRQRWQEREKKEKKEDIPKEQPMGVSATPDCGFQHHQAPYHCFARGLFWLFTPFIIRGMLRYTSVWLIARSFSFTWEAGSWVGLLFWVKWKNGIGIKSRLHCCVVTTSEQPWLCFLALTWESYLTRMQTIIAWNTYSYSWCCLKEAKVAATGLVQEGGEINHFLWRGKVSMTSSQRKMENQ